MHPYLGVSKLLSCQNAVRGRESSEEPITTNIHVLFFVFFTKVVTGTSVFIYLLIQ